MFHRQTLFVLGAGASFEAGLPTGKTLAKEIAKQCTAKIDGSFISEGGKSLFSQLVMYGGEQGNEFHAAASIIRDGLGFVQSIDDFLDQHRNNRSVNLYGKAAIVKSILEAERKSSLYFDNENRFDNLNSSKLDETWYNKFVSMLCRGIAKEDVKRIFDNVSFVVFNYDRCLEHFLFNALKQTYALRSDEAFKVLSNVHIIHPYGMVSTNVLFGDTRPTINYVKLAEQIKTYTEQVAIGDLIPQIRDEVERAESIIFLGFGYHSQNMSLLQPDRPKPICPVLGTAYGMSTSDVQVVTNSFGKWFQNGSNIKIDNSLKCTTLFDHYAKSLTGGD